jgi:integrase
MPNRVLTDKFLESLLRKKPTERVTYTEPGRKGLLMRHEPGGTLSFWLRYQRDGKPQFLHFGEYPAISLDEAHEAHAAARKLLKSDLDPKAEQEAATRARKAAELREIRTTGVTSRNVIAEWAWHYARKNRKHPREAVRLLKVYVGKPWKGRPVRDLEKRDAVLLLDRIKARAPVMANRIYNLALQAFTKAVERDLITTNPFIGVPKKPGGKEEPRERSLTPDEVRAFWSGLDHDDTEISRPVRLALRLILVTAQRPGEVAGAKWSEFDTKAALWTIPAARAKNDREHLVPLTKPALDIIAELRELASDRPHLLPSVHSKLKRDESLSQRALSRALHNNIAKGRLFGCEPFTPHDLRRTAASMMTSLGIPRLHVAKVLNHTDQDVTGAVYDKHHYFAEKKHALETWATDLQAIIAGKERKVVPIRSGKAA